MVSVRTVTLQEISVDLFQPLLGQSFRVADTDTNAGGEQSETQLELVELLPLARTRPSDGKQCFSVVFRRTGGVERPDGLYRVQHADFEISMLFLARISYTLDPGDRQSYYESIFN
jgi:hypothetical protein